MSASIFLLVFAGKYDESYVYEKETDILSDSDPTDCEQDLMACGPGCDTDTGGEEAGDEDTAFDEMDYIDAEYGYSIHEDAHDNKFKNTGKCTYHGYHEVNLLLVSRNLNIIWKL